MRSVGSLTFTFIAYALIKSMILFEQGASPIELPEFPTPSITVDLDFVEVSGVDAVAEAVQNIAIGLKGIAVAVIDFATFSGELTVYALQLLAFIITNAFTGIDGAPTYINTLFLAVPTTLLGIIAYKLLRSGDSDA